MFITKIKAFNFSGIKDIVDINFVEGGKAEKNGYLNYQENRISLINGFYGANASGKTTVLNIIDKIFEIMINVRPDFFITPTGSKQEAYICYPNYQDDMEEKLTELEIGFVVNENEYNYKVTIEQGKNIVSEVLEKNNDIVFTRDASNLSFERKYKELGASFENYTISPKSSFLSQLINGGLSPKIAQAIISDIKSLAKSSCFVTDKRMVNQGQNNINGLFNVVFNYLHNPEINKENYLKNLNSIAKFFEPNLKEIVINQKDASPSGQEVEYGLQYENSKRLLPIMEASAGTRELISYINEILSILKTGGIVVYDETSKYYHPEMEISILSLFKDKDMNKNNAQIFFSSHNHETFDLLHINQAYIVEKEGGVVAVNRVSDFDIQERDNVKKKYRLGSLGGVPDTIDFKRVINNLL